MVQYFVGVAEEFHQIRWLSIRRACWFSVVVIVVSLVLGFALGAADNVFAALLKIIVT